MKPETTDLFIQYMSSGWGLLANGLFIILFGMIAYNTYAKRWSAKTGRFFTEAKITWSEPVSYTHLTLPTIYSV